MFDRAEFLIMYALMHGYEFLGLLKKWFKDSGFKVSGSIETNMLDVSDKIEEEFDTRSDHSFG